MRDAGKTADAEKEALAEVAEAEKTAEKKVEQDKVPHAFLHMDYMCKKAATTAEFSVVHKNLFLHAAVTTARIKDGSV